MATRVQDASIRGLLMLGCSFEGQRTMGDAAPWPSACRRGDDLELGCGRLGQIKIDPERKPTLRLLIVKNPSSCSAARENDDACTTGRLKRELEDARKAISRRMQPTIARKKPLADEGALGASEGSRDETPAARPPPLCRSNSEPELGTNTAVSSSLLLQSVQDRAKIAPLTGRCRRRPEREAPVFRAPDAARSSSSTKASAQVAHADVAIICETVKLIAFYNTLLIAFVASVVLVIVCMIASTSANTVTRWLELHYKK
eukprot:tig00000826_g4583.t1